MLGETRVERSGEAGSTLVTQGTVGAHRYVPGLDGIRAVAVLAVLLFHFGAPGLDGGLLGVDVFFVLSGFLITSLLVQEWAETGTLRFGAFYARRARRLLPGLLLLLALVAVYAAWFANPATLTSVRGDALATLAYVANWHFILSDQGYFQWTGPPSPLLHTWSLAVEEQFYLVWPAVCWVVLRRFGRRGLAVAALVGIAASFGVTTALVAAHASVDRLYYGTDVRTQEIMVGALLAVGAPRLVRWLQGGGASQGTARGARWRRWGLTLAGTAGLVALFTMFHTVSGAGTFLYRGGFLVVAVAAAAVIALVVHLPRSVVAQLLALGPIRYLGKISYGVYLYHFPLFLILTAPRTGLVGPALLALRLASTLVLASLSYHLVESPVRDRRLVTPRRLAVVLPTAAVLIAGAVVATTTLAATGLSGEPPAAAVEARPALFAVPARPPAGLTGNHQVRIVLEGDSLAMTLGAGLGVEAARWGASLTNLGAVGCDLDWQDPVYFEDTFSEPAQGCKDWPSTFRQMVDRIDPDVVALELGRWEVSSRLIDGHWSTIGQPAWDRLYSAELGSAIRVLSSRGAKVVVFTLPYISGTTEAPNGLPWDINQPARTKAYNALVRRVVARFAPVASVIDLNAMLDPAGHYVSYLDGIRVRDLDDEHISPAGGMLLRPRILPQLVALGREHAAARLVAHPVAHLVVHTSPGEHGRGSARSR